MKATVQHLSALVLLLVLACGADPLPEESVRAMGESSADGLGLMARALEKCGSWSNLGSCLKMKAVTLLDRALHGGPVVINDYLTLTPDPAAKEESGRALTETEIEATLPKDEEAKESVLDEMISDKMSRFFNSRSFKFTMPTEVVAEGRKDKYKDKKGGGMGIMMAMMASVLIQTAMAKIALLAGKALLVGKMALVLSAIIGLKKLVSSGGESHQVVYADHAGGGHGWGRSAAAHDLAYSAQARANLK